MGTSGAWSEAWLLFYSTQNVEICGKNVERPHLVLVWLTWHDKPRFAKST